MIEYEEEYIAEELARLIRETEAVEMPRPYLAWRAGFQRFMDACERGADHWAKARQAALDGKRYLGYGELAVAEHCMILAHEEERLAYRAQMTKANLAKLNGAKPRGRKAGSGSPAIAERNRWLAEAVAAQIARGIADGPTAILAALADPAADPKIKAAFRNMKAGGIARALAAGRKLSAD